MNSKLSPDERADLLLKQMTLDEKIQLVHGSFGAGLMVSVINLLFTFVALWLIDRAGRKRLIIAGTTLQFLSFAAVGWLYYVTVAASRF